ncbi:MAG: hypothetical protein GY714_20975 [Desulfobacterales bacterium]|nr:hypothetical protein [Desulfobacterales bacterium]
MAIFTNGVEKVKQYAKIEDRKIAETHGGTFTQDAWQTRDLTDCYSNCGISISSNQIEFEYAGNYYIKCIAPGNQVNRHQSKLYDITNTADKTDINGEDVLGGTVSSHGSSASVTNSIFEAIITVVAGDIFEIRHYCQTTKATSGFGISGSWGEGVFTQVYIEKL